MQEEENRALDHDIKLAQEILSSRPSSSSAVLLPKGGVKFSDNRGTKGEEERLQYYYNARKSVLSMMKVRKLANLGLAEWLPEYCVAKIIKQGKFMQVQGVLHENDFLALYAEEALFLLDIGDIELLYKGVSLSMQDAFCLMLSCNSKPEACSFEQYCVYAHLCRMGFRVQRCQKQLLKSENKSLDKRLADQNSNRSMKIKKPKCEYFDKDFPNESIASNSTESTANHNQEIDDLLKGGASAHALAPKKSESKICRDWWSCSENTITFSESKSTSCSLSHASRCTKLPNLGERDETERAVLHKLPEHLIPRQTSSWKYEIENIWYERLRKDDRTSSKSHLVYSYPNRLDYNRICRQATNWPHFNSLVKSANTERQNKMNDLCDSMYLGEIKPLLDPRTVDTLKTIRSKLKVFNEFDAGHDSFRSDSYKLHFNVYQTASDKPFKKTNPGKPFVRVCVVNSDDPVPSLADTKALSSVSGGIPVKIALVNSGKIMFFGFDDIDIPIDLHNGS